MRLLPLVLSAHPSSWHNDAANGERQGRTIDPPADASCRFCGWSAHGWQEWFHLNGDHNDQSPDNKVASCVLCHLVQHLDRPRIDEEATLIWLPEMSQAAVIALSRRVHQVLLAHGEPPHMGRRPRSAVPPIIAAFSAYRALRTREGALAERLGATSPPILGAALLGLRSDVTGGPADRLVGIRLLPLGRLFRGGEDIYPRLLNAAHGSALTSGTKPC